jgi:hypothetical protein
MASSSLSALVWVSVVTHPPTAIAHSMANAGAWSDMVRSIEIRCLV